MGLTHLDAGVIIGLLDGADAHHAAARRALADALARGDRLSLAASALSESLVGAARRGPAAMELVRTVIERLPVLVIGVDATIATQAAVLRARHRSLRLPDALVIATAATTDADRLMTTDHRWPTADQMKLAISIERL